ncbi:MAG: transposase [Patescibacteria group bacterium]|nr:transposase [Patescibacteria group bacterium]
MKNIWPDETTYFITSSTFLHYPYFKTDEQKQIVLGRIKGLKNKFNCLVSAYSVAINHYHLKIYLEKGSDIPKIKQYLNGGITFLYKKNFKIKYDEFWQSCKVLKIEDEEISQRVSAYIAGNLLKHKEVSTFNELLENPFSSFAFMSDKYGEDLVRELIYDSIDIEEDKEGIVDIKKLK